MPGRLFLTTPPGALAMMLAADASAMGDEPPRQNIAPGQEIIVCTPERRLTRMRWGVIPVGRVNARGRPVLETIVNIRGETMFDKTAFQGFRRGVVPADGWYEWTGETRRKTAWRIRSREGQPLVFAALWDIWRAPGGRELAQVATVTCEPNAEVREIHHRMGVFLDPNDIATWLDGSDAEAHALIRPWSEGRLIIEKAEGVDWSAP